MMEIVMGQKLYDADKNLYWQVVNVIKAGGVYPDPQNIPITIIDQPVIKSRTDGHNVQLGRAFLESLGGDPDKIAGVVAHEVGHHVLANISGINKDPYLKENVADIIAACILNNPAKIRELAEVFRNQEGVSPNHPDWESRAANLEKMANYIQRTGPGNAAGLLEDIKSCKNATELQQRMAIYMVSGKEQENTIAATPSTQSQAPQSQETSSMANALTAIGNMNLQTFPVLNIPAELLFVASATPQKQVQSTMGIA
jgi:hypothetical protein